MIFIDAFFEEEVPSHMNTHQFYVHLRRILNDDGCLATNANVSNNATFDQLIQALTASFEVNILLAHNNTIENARIIISGNHSCLVPIISQSKAIHEAEQFQSNARLEFSLARLLSLAYKGSID